MIISKHNPICGMAVPARIIITAVILFASAGISHAQGQPRKALRIGFPFPAYIANPLPDEEALAFDFLTDLPLGTYSEDAGVNWRTKEEPLYLNHQRIFPAFSTTQELDGGKTFFAELKQNVLFHDGSTATVDEVEFSINRHPERSPATQRIKFTKLTPNSFTLSSDRPEHWGELLDVPLMKPAGAGKKSISAGPYIITDVDRKKRKVRLKAFEKYINGPPPAPEVEYTFYKNSELAMFGFLEDETDFICGLRLRQGKIIGTQSDRKVVRYTSNDVFMLMFNTAKPPMDDILVRKAISLLIDRHRLVSMSDSLRGAAIPTQYQFALSAPVTKPHADPHAPEEASKLLQKAGYTRTTKGWEKNGKPIQLSMLLSEHHTAYIPEARMITKGLYEAGLDTTFNLVPMINHSDRQVFFNKSHFFFGAIYDKMEFENNSTYFEPGAHDTFQTPNPDLATLLAGAKSDSLTPAAKETIIRKVADFTYTAPLFYPVDFCASKGNTGYEDVFFRSPIIYSIINRNVPPSSLPSKTGLNASVR